MHVLSLPQNKFGLVFFRLFDGALETSNFRFEEARSVITLLRCFLHENTQRGKIARVKFAEELSTMSKNRLRWITLVRGPIWGIHSLTLMISWLVAINPQLVAAVFQNHIWFSMDGVAIAADRLLFEDNNQIWRRWNFRQIRLFRTNKNERSRTWKSPFKSKIKC